MHILFLCLLIVLFLIPILMCSFNEPKKRKLYGTKEFQIVQNDYFHEGGITKTEYFIQEKCRMFWNIKWVDVTETNCGWGDCYEVAVTFETKEQAQKYVEKLCQSDIWKGKRQTVVDNHKC